MQLDYNHWRQVLLRFHFLLRNRQKHGSSHHFLSLALRVPYSPRQRIDSCFTDWTVKNSRLTFTAWPWPVALPSDSNPEIKAAADRLSKALKNPLNVIQTDQNPVCALWLEVGSWNPNPSTPGYVILIQPGGGQILASDLKLLEKAISRLNQQKRIRNGKTELPIGVITSYPTISES